MAKHLDSAWRHHDSESWASKANNTLQVGDMIQVFSQHADVWVEGVVVKIDDQNYAQVEYEIDNEVCRKILHVHSDHLKSSCCHDIHQSVILEIDPGMIPVPPKGRRCCDEGKLSQGCDYSPTEARSALGDFTITFQDGKRGSALDLLDLAYVEENAFSCTWNGGPLQGHFEIEYSPKIQIPNDDVVLKVHARPSEDPNDKYWYKEVGFLHTLLHKLGEKVTFTPPCDKYVLGLTIHKGLSKDLQDRMKANERDRIYIQRLIDRFKQSWAERGEARAEVHAENADFLISYTGENKALNDELLQWLTTNPILGPHSRRVPQVPRYCTDRSLGFGVHFHDVEHGDMIALSLGKHGFAQPVAGNGWWGEYKSAAMKTKHGMLVLNPSPEYFASIACQKEFGMAGLRYLMFCRYDDDTESYLRDRDKSRFWFLVPHEGSFVIKEFDEFWVMPHAWQILRDVWIPNPGPDSCNGTEGTGDGNDWQRYRLQNAAKYSWVFDT